MVKNHSYDLGVLSVAELIDFLQSLPDKYRDWQIYFCGSDEFFFCVNEEEGYIVADMEDVFDEFDEEELECLKDYPSPKTFLFEN